MPVLIEAKHANIARLKQVCEVWREGEKLDVMLSSVVENLGCEVIFTAIHDDKSLLSWIRRLSEPLKVLNLLKSDYIISITRRCGRESCVLREVICDLFDQNDDTGKDDKWIYDPPAADIASTTVTKTVSCASVKMGCSTS